MPSFLILIDMLKVTQLITGRPGREWFKYKVLLLLSWQVGSYCSALPFVHYFWERTLTGQVFPKCIRRFVDYIYTRLKGGRETPSIVREIWSGSSQPKSLIYFYFNTQLPPGENWKKYWSSRYLFSFILYCMRT